MMMEMLKCERCCDGPCARSVNNHQNSVSGSTSNSNALLARIPCTKDGVRILWGDTVYTPHPDRVPWDDDYILAVEVESIAIGSSSSWYTGTHIIVAGDVEFGNLDCYSDKELVPVDY